MATPYKKKSLGQNFLNNDHILNKIVDAAHLESGAFVLEVGPGDGALTQIMLNRGYNVVAIEIDQRMVALLQKKFATAVESGQLQLLHADILEVDLGKVVGNFSNRNYHVLANIPYYITGAIIRRLLESAYFPQSMTLIMQREVADRIVELDGKGSLLSKSVQVFGQPKRSFVIKRGNFTPVPAIDSALLHIAEISHDAFEKAGITRELFFTVARTGFAHKRKTLFNNFKNLEGVNADRIQEWFEKLSCDIAIRPERVSLELWISFAREYASCIL